MTADFVAERGGGLLVLGGRSFAQRGLIGTPLEEVLPVELNDRRGGARRAVADDRRARPRITRLSSRRMARPTRSCASAPRRTRRASCGRRCRRLRRARRSEVRARRLGARRDATPSGGVCPLVAVQRYGRGGRWCLPAKRRGAGGCCWPPPIARTSSSGGRRRWLSSRRPTRWPLSVPGCARARRHDRDRHRRPRRGVRPGARATGRSDADRAGWRDAAAR